MPGADRGRAPGERERPARAGDQPGRAGLRPGEQARRPRWVRGAARDDDGRGSGLGRARPAGAAWAGAAVTATAATSSAAASTARSAAQDHGALGHRGRHAGARVRVGGGRERDHGQGAPGAEPEAHEGAERRIAERHAQRGERPHGEGEDERGEAEPEQHAVAGRGQWHRQHPPPRLGHLAAHLRHDPHAARLAERGRERDGRRHRERGAAAGPERRAGRASPPNVTTPPASAPAANVAQAASVVRSRPA